MLGKLGKLGNGKGKRRGGFRFALASAAALAILLGAAPTAPAATTFLIKWGSPGTGNGQFGLPVGLGTDAAGDVYVAESNNNRIQKFTAAGAFLIKWGTPGALNGQFSAPHGVATDSAGNVYVADTNNNRIQKFTAAGGFLTKWGTLGALNGQFDTPQGIATDAAGNVYVADTFNRRIQKFTAAGAFLTKWGSSGTGNGQFGFPVGIATDAAGNVFVADTGNNRVQKFTAAGAFLAKWGSSGALDGQFSLPQGLATDAAGDVYVADALNHRIQKFTAAGAFLAKFGSPGTGDGQFDTPDGVATGTAGSVFVADTGNNRIQKFRQTTVSPPVLASSVVVSPVSGVVLIKRPGATVFTPLTADANVPIGSILDATRGTVRLTSAKDSKGSTQTAIFFDGVFQVLQKRAKRPVTEARLVGGDFGVCTSAAARRSGPQSARKRRSKRRVRRLWGDGKGRFRTRGKHSSSAVRGTRWLVEDRCDGTRTKVRRGKVAVSDFARRKTVLVKAGHSYLARAR